mgnify:CR=1 FL=1
MWKMTVLDKVVQVLLIVGGLNWGLVAIKSSYNLVDKLPSSLSRVVYYVVGLAAVYALYKAVTMMSEKSE